MKYLFITIAFYTAFYSNAQVKHPIEVTKKVADYILKKTAFEYEFNVFKPSSQLSDLQVINFKRNFGGENSQVRGPVRRFGDCLSERKQIEK